MFFNSADGKDAGEEVQQHSNMHSCNAMRSKNLPNIILLADQTKASIENKNCIADEIR